MEKENNSVEQIDIDTDDDSSKDQYLKSDRYNNIFYHKDNDIVLEYMRDGVFEDPALVNINTQAREFTIFPGFEKLLSLQMAKGLISYEYQIYAAKKVLNTFRGRAMLCDEVGLGKTVEAGIVLLEYILRGLVRRVLILTPPSLTTQWQEEMESKFGLKFILHDDPEFRSGGIDSWHNYDKVIASIHTAKQKQNADEISKINYDMLIIDEAHYLRNRNTQQWKFVNSLKKKYMLMLTATPIQGNLEELYNIITILKPGQLKTISEFKKTFMQRGDHLKPKNIQRLRELLSGVMVRNTRALTHVNLPPRNAHIIRIEFTEAERMLYDNLTDFVKQNYTQAEQHRDKISRFTLRTLQEEIGSSTFSVLPTLEKMIQKKGGNIEGLIKLYELAESIKDNAKTEAMIKVINAHQDKVIVFTKFTRTLEHISDTLNKYGISFSKFAGSMSIAEKDHSIVEFSGKTQVLVSTEIGGEGRNLQFCNAIINYDLPWNPQRIEQRIGRIHRVGQKREVYIFNFSAENTIESYILNVLDAKINMFELVVGEVDMILGNLEDEKDFADIIMDIWVNSTTQMELEKGMEDLGEKLVEARKEYIKIKEYDNHLFGDYFHA
ncbi:MAG: SNF2-related protein [Candidatus Poribacteria bacterium]